MQERYRKLSENMKGEKNPFYGKHHTIEARKKISANAKGRVPLEETKHKLSIALLGRKRLPFSDEWKQNISKGSQGKILSEEHKINIGNALRGKIRGPISEEWRQNLSKARKKARERKNVWIGRHHTEESKKKMSESHIGMYAGKKHPNWQGGISKINEKLRKKEMCRGKYKKWRLSILSRDNFTCLICQKIGGSLHSHHIKSWIDYPELRYDINNGITLCEDCHKTIHKQDIDCLEYMEKIEVAKPVDKMFGY